MKMRGHVILSPVRTLVLYKDKNDLPVSPAAFEVSNKVKFYGF
jgi:hypothetical protein